MSALSVAVHDSSTMTRRSLRRIVRYPSMTIILVGMPVVFSRHAKKEAKERRHDRRRGESPW